MEEGTGIKVRSSAAWANALPEKNNAATAANVYVSWRREAKRRRLFRSGDAVWSMRCPFRMNTPGSRSHFSAECRALFSQACWSEMRSLQDGGWWVSLNEVSLRG